MNDLKPFLDSLFSRYNSKIFISSDPIKWVHLYVNPLDIEISAFISSVFAYGRVDQIDLALQKIFLLLGKEPYTFLTSSSDSEIFNSIQTIYYRFFTPYDIYALLLFLKYHFLNYSTLSVLFSTETGIVSFHLLFEKWNMFIESNNLISFGTRYMIPDPKKKSASKRMMMFLRWMVRKDEIDLGIWKSIKTDQLLFPLDTHVSRICFYLGLSINSKSTLKNSVQITNNLRRFDKNDPVKFDFAISRLGILNECPSKHNEFKCTRCQLETVCSR